LLHVISACRGGPDTPRVRRHPEAPGRDPDREGQAHPPRLDEVHAEDPRGTKRTRAELEKLVKDTIAKLQKGAKIRAA